MRTGDAEARIHVPETEKQNDTKGKGKERDHNADATTPIGVGREGSSKEKGKEKEKEKGKEKDAEKAEPETGLVTPEYEERESFRFRDPVFLRSLEGLSPEEIRKKKEALARNIEIGHKFYRLIYGEEGGLIG